MTPYRGDRRPVFDITYGEFNCLAMGQAWVIAVCSRECQTYGFTGGECCAGFGNKLAIAYLKTVQFITGDGDQGVGKTGLVMVGICD